MAAAMDIGAAGSKARGSAVAVALESAALPSPVPGIAGFSALRRIAGIKRTANAAVENIRTLNLIVDSRTARRVHQESVRQVHSTRMEHLRNPHSRVR